MLMDHYKWDTKQYDCAVGALQQIGNMCARNASATPLDVAWEKLKEAGYVTNQRCMTNCLYVSSTFATVVQPLSTTMAWYNKSEQATLRIGQFVVSNNHRCRWWAVTRHVVLLSNQVTQHNLTTRRVRLVSWIDMIPIAMLWMTEKKRSFVLTCKN